ncbi:hypothetical protein Ahy_B09g099344 [Arachis hypogaea]|uniref:Uncharacterized protein n=1 Tax=Arachis hypogaea TaxID=3818 RepID=A0A444XUF2_ARAHY|nr:hypothetical protein Ahy_B09g099344 [Arachis hypogaea]
MAFDGVSSSSRRSGGGGREEQFAEGWVRNGKDDKDGVSPKCFCGENAIMFMSKTSNNPNRLFLGCSFYKMSTLQGLGGVIQGTGERRKLVTLKSMNESKTWKIGSNFWRRG